MAKTIRNIGIFAHADAGKTTIAENFLFTSGKIKLLGSVDKGTTQTDYLKVEKTRGISVKSSYLSFNYKNTLINLIDTPGHIDFSAETERSLLIVDAAIIIVSAAEGVQAHTETLWNGLRERHIPTIIFLNKVDRRGVDSKNVIEEVKKELSSSIAVFHDVNKEGYNDVSIQTVWNAEFMCDKIIENLAEFDAEIFDEYVEGKIIGFEKADNSLKKAIKNCNIYPLLLGSAKYSLGIDELLDAVIRYFPEPEGDDKKNLSALIFGIYNDKKRGTIHLVKVFNGKIKNRDNVYNCNRKTDEKITQVLKIFAESLEDVGTVFSGDIAGIRGLKDAEIGDVLGQRSEHLPKEISLKKPLLTVQVIAEQDKDYSGLAYALEELSKEDPALDFEWLKSEKEFNIKVMGQMQIQILEGILEDRFKIKTKFEAPVIIYKETPQKKGEGFVKYWMPKPCWAILKFKIEPGERGSGIVYSSEISVDDVQQKYQKEVEKTIPASLKQGIKGWEVTDIKITLIQGEDHKIHSRSGDFVVATPMGIMDGLVNTSTSLLEPVISFKIAAPEEFLAKIVGEITNMRGSFESPEIMNNSFLLKGHMPLASSLDFPVKLNSISKGRAKISTKFHSWQECLDEEGCVREFKGISPLDTSKYILKARKALK